MIENHNSEGETERIKFFRMVFENLGRLLKLDGKTPLSDPLPIPRELAEMIHQVISEMKDQYENQYSETLLSPEPNCDEELTDQAHVLDIILRHLFLEDSRAGADSEATLLNEFEGYLVRNQKFLKIPLKTLRTVWWTLRGYLKYR